MTFRVGLDGATASLNNRLNDAEAKPDTTALLGLARAKIVIKNMIKIFLSDTSACVMNVHVQTWAIVIVRNEDFDHARYGIVKCILHYVYEDLHKAAFIAN